MSLCAGCSACMCVGVCCRDEDFDMESELQEVGPPLEDLDSKQTMNAPVKEAIQQEPPTKDISPLEPSNSKGNKVGKKGKKKQEW